MYERRTGEEHLSRFEDERRVWQEEKEKVNRSKEKGEIIIVFFMIDFQSLSFSFNVKPDKISHSDPAN